MSTQSELLAEIDAFLAGRKMSETTFGRKAVNDGKFVGRLRSGRRCWPETADKAREFMAADSDVAEQGEAA
jgi:hypothetical protein